MNVKSYEVAFRSDWRFEARAFIRSWKYSPRKIKILVYASLPLVMVLVAVLVIHNVQRHDFLMAALWTLNLLLPILYLIGRLKPKTYKTSLRGLIIDGQLHRWKNYRGYFADGEMLYLVNRAGGIVALPRRFEDAVKDFVPKLAFQS